MRSFLSPMAEGSKIGLPSPAMRRNEHKRELCLQSFIGNALPSSRTQVTQGATARLFHSFFIFNVHFI